MYFDKCLFPVTPEKISIKINGNNKTVNLINEGEINILKKAGLTDIEFEAKRHSSSLCAERPRWEKNC